MNRETLTHIGLDLSETVGIVLKAPYCVTRSLWEDSLPGKFIASVVGSAYFGVPLLIAANAIAESGNPISGVAAGLATYGALGFVTVEMAVAAS